MNWRTLGLRHRVILGVALAGLTFLVMAGLGSRVAEQRFAEYVANNIATTADLEAARIDDALEAALLHLAALADRSQVKPAVRTYSLGSPGDLALIQRAVSEVQTVAAEFASLTVLGPDYQVLGTTSAPRESGDPLPSFDEFDPFGAVRGDPGETGLVPIRVPIRLSEDPDGDYWLVGEFSLKGIQDLIATPAQGGRTVEAHMARLRDDGDVEYITPLRFEPEAAFSRVLPGDASDLPMVGLVNGVEGTLIDVPDYRSEPSIVALRLIDRTGWGLMVKIDLAEATAPARSLETVLMAGIVLSGLVSIGVVGGLFRPVMRRIDRMTSVAKAVNDGDYETRINDESDDELSAVADAFDLAVDGMQASLDEKGRFVAAVSHELRTPLTAVLGLSAALASQADRFSTAEIEEFAGLIQSGASELTALVEDLLTAARMQAGSLVVEQVDLELASLVAAAIEDLPAEIGRKVAIDIIGDLCAAADEMRVRQVVRNLVTNAYKYGGESIKVELIQARGQVGVRVSDDGDGVPPDFAKRIFDPYERAHRNVGTTDSVGLGLNIARELAQRMGGDLTYARDGSWTVFDLLLPPAADSSRSAERLPNAEALVSRA